VNFKESLKKAKKRLLQMHFESQVGHIGGNLSSLDVILLLHLKIMEDDDQFVLSKGHSAGALYVTLWILGKISDEQLKEFHKDNSKLTGHPVAGWMPEILFSTGSLGHGLPLSCGLALGKKFKEENGMVFCLMSDGEWEEGSNWEALIFLSHHCLDNLVILVDVNGLQGFGTTKEIASMDTLAEKLESFAIEVEEVNGHDQDEIEKAILKPCSRPKAVILNTIKGHGISFMENRMEWHYLSLSQEQYLRALYELET
jgi:transketolase